MFKLFVNNIQVGSYPSMKTMMNSLLMVYLQGKTTKWMEWNGNKLRVFLYEDWELKNKGN